MLDKYLDNFYFEDTSEDDVSSSDSEEVVDKSLEDKKSREQFQIIVHKRIVDLLNSTSKTVDSLMKLDMPAGVDIEIRT